MRIVSNAYALAQARGWAAGFRHVWRNAAVVVLEILEAALGRQA